MSEPALSLTAEEFDLLYGDRAGGERPPYPLEVAAVGTTVEERVRRTDDVYGRLAERGLANRDRAGNDRLDAQLESLLRLLSRRTVSIDVVGYTDRPVRALAGADRDSGVLAEIVDDQVWLSRIRPTALASAVVELLPDDRPGPLGPMSVPRRALARAARSDSDDDDEDAGFALLDDPDERTVLVRAGMSTKDANKVVRLAEDRRAGGQFGVSRGDRRSSTLVTWLDTSDGRYLAVSENSWLSFAPADAARITQRLSEVLRITTGSR